MRKAGVTAAVFKIDVDGMNFVNWDKGRRTSPMRTG